MKLLFKILPFLALLLSAKMFSQDTLFLRNGQQEIGKVEEISRNEVKYKKVGNTDGPSYLEQKDNILIIKFKNGTSEEFEYIKPWNRPEEKNEFKPIAQKKFPELKKVGARYWYGDKILNESEMQDILLDTKNSEIINYIQIAKRQRGWQHIGFAAFQCGLASIYFLSESVGGVFGNQYNNTDQQYINNAKIFAVLGMACVTTSITLKVKRNKNNAEALKLYQQTFN